MCPVKNPLSLGVLLFATLVASTQATADELPVPDRVFYPSPEDAAERFAWHGESNTFSIKILGSEALRAGIEVGRVGHDDEFGAVIPIHVVGTTVGLLDTIYPVDNESLTLLDADGGLLPLYTDSDYNERDYVTRLVLSYERERYSQRVLRIEPDEVNQVEIVSVPRDVYDDLSMVYDVRSRELSPGNGFVYHTHDGENLTRVTVTVLRTEDVFTETFGYVECAVLAWVLEPLESTPVLPFGAESLPPTYRPSGPANAIALSFVSNDDRRLLIGSDVQTSIGMMTIRLVGNEGGRNEQ
jgi:hypothetical protein